MYEPVNSASFARDIKRCKKKHWDTNALSKAIVAIAESDTTALPVAYNDHALTGDMKGYRELHIGGRNSNWIIVYRIVDNRVEFIRTGTHDEVFE